MPVNSTNPASSLRSTMPSVYIRESKGIRDVLLSGGDPFTLSTSRLKEIVARLYEIPHVEIIRYRVPPPRSSSLSGSMILWLIYLNKYQPVWINNHYNHPKEITPRSRQSLTKLADAGFVLGNQSVLMCGLKDCPYIIKELCQRLIESRVRPYRLYQCDLSSGISHFRTSISTGIQIIELLSGHTGFAIPEFMIDLPGRGGKMPVHPRHMISQSDRVVIFRNNEGVIASYIEPEDTSFLGCPEKCTICKDREAHGLDHPKVRLEKIYGGSPQPGTNRPVSKQEQPIKTRLNTSNF
jgi:lysine 2,3-aminomutase